MAFGIGAAIGTTAALTAAGTAGNAIAQGKLNKKNRKWQEKMYERRLADQRADWQMQNEYNEKLTAEYWDKYNSPTAQLREQKAAGLNPDLNGLDGSSVDSSGAPMGSAPDAGSAPYQSSGFDLIGSFGQVMSMFQQIQAGSLDNDMKRQQIKSMAKDDVLNHLVNLYDPRQDLPPIPTDVDGLGTGSNGEIETLKASKRRGDATKYYRNLGYSRQAARIAYNMQKQFNKDDVKAAYYGKKFSTAQGRKEYFEAIASPMFSDNDEDMRKNFSVYAEKMAEFEELLRGAQSAQATFNTDFYNNRNGASEGKSTTSNVVDSAGIVEQNFQNGKTQADLNAEFDKFVNSIPSMHGFGDVLKSLFQFMWLRGFNPKSW